MGIGPSTTRRVKVETPAMLDTYGVDKQLIESMADKKNLKHFHDALDVVIDYHTKIINVFNTIANSIGPSGKKMVTLDEDKHIKPSDKETPPFLLYLKEAYGGENGQDAETVEMLFDINAVHEDYVPSSNNTLERSMVVFPDFQVGYERFIQHLTRLRRVDGVEVGLNKDVIDQNDSELMKKHEDVGLVVNRFLARIMFLQYAIEYNDYLSLTYTMFAARLFRDLDEIAEYVGEMDEDE